MQPDQSIHRKFWTNPFTVILGAIILFFGTQVAGGFLLAAFTGGAMSENQRLAIYVGCNVIILTSLLSVLLKLTGFRWRSIGLIKPKLKALLSVIPAFAVYFAISTVFTLLAIKFIPGFQADQVQDVGFDQPKGAGELAIGFISLIILTPIFEEIIFRGVLFKGLRKQIGFWLTAVLVSVIFAIAHGQWNVAVDTFALSLILCWLVERSGSIIPAIILHSIKNALAFVLLFLL